MIQEKRAKKIVLAACLSIHRVLHMFFTVVFFVSVESFSITHTSKLFHLSFPSIFPNDVLVTGVNSSKIETMGSTVSVDSQRTFFEKKCLRTVVNR